MSKFIAVDIIKETFTTVFLEVPDDFDPRTIAGKDFRTTLTEAVDDLDSYDWSTDNDWATGSTRFVTPDEARMFDVFVVKP